MLESTTGPRRWHSTTEVRRRVYALMEQGPVGNPASRVINAVLVLTITLSLLTTILETVPAYHEQYGHLFPAIELTVFIIFAIEFCLRIWISVDHIPLRALGPLRARLRYVTSPFGLIDAAALVPFLVSFAGPADFKLFVIVRVVRFLKLTRYSPAVQSLLDALYSERRALAGCALLITGATLCAAAFMHLAERAVQPEKFGTLPDAMWWAIVTLGTVGYGDAVPVTAIGRLIAAVTIFAGVIMVALPIGIIATAFASEIHKRDFVVTWGLVARVPLFRELSALEIADVMKLLHARRVEPGAIIVRKGEQANSMYLIADGEVEIRLNEKRVRLGTGHFFGEIALLGRRHRSATVRAISSTSLLVIDASDFEALMESNPRIAQRVQDVVRERLGAESVSDDGDLAITELQDDEREPATTSKKSPREPI